MTTRTDLHTTITSQLIAAIEAGAGQPSLPWRRGGTTAVIPSNVASGNAYNGINIVNLWTTAQVRGYGQPVWGTYKQWTDAGCQVRRGEKSSLVVFYREYETSPRDDMPDDDGKRRVLRGSAVFNADQVEGFKPEAPAPLLGPIERIARADAFTSATRADIRYGGDRAYFRPDTDHIQMPEEGLFTGTETMTRNEGYYATLLHELGITQDVRPDHAAYLANWLQLLKSDPKAIFTAAARASEAVSFLKTR